MPHHPPIRVLYKVSRLSLEQDLEPLAEINQVFIKQLNRQTGSTPTQFLLNSLFYINCKKVYLKKRRTCVHKKCSFYVELQPAKVPKKFEVLTNYGERLFLAIETTDRLTTRQYMDDRPFKFSVLNNHREAILQMDGDTNVSIVDFAQINEPKKSAHVSAEPTYYACMYCTHGKFLSVVFLCVSLFSSVFV